MSDESKDVKTVKTQAPATGKGSPAGPRWFVSKNPGLVLEVVPERYPDRDGNRAPFLRVAFKSETKSELHQGEGYLGTRNKLGTDTNANRHYGVFFIIDPGPMPKDGYQDDESQVKDEKGIEREDWSRTSEEKARDRRILDHIRKTYMYRHTPQDNQYRITGRLIELNWDPAEIRSYVSSMVIPGMGKPMSRPPLEGAPAEGRPEGEPQTGRTPNMGSSVRVSRRVVPA